MDRSGARGYFLFVVFRRTDLSARLVFILSFIGFPKSIFSGFVVCFEALDLGVWFDLSRFGWLEFNAGVRILPEAESVISPKLFDTIPSF